MGEFGLIFLSLLEPMARREAAASVRLMIFRKFRLFQKFPCFPENYVIQSFLTAHAVFLLLEMTWPRPFRVLFIQFSLGLYANLWLTFSHFTFPTSCWLTCLLL